MNSDTSKVDKAVQLLNQRGLDGLIIYSNGMHRMGPQHLYYFSGLKPLGPNNAMIISKSGDVTLLVEPSWDSIRASTKTFVSDTRGSSDFARDLIGIMREFKIAGSVGVVGSKDMTEDLYSMINKQARVEIAHDIVEGMAKEKTEKELDIVRKAAKIADIGFEAILKHARVGIREYELAAEVEFAMRSAGSEDNFNLLSSGKHNHEMHAPGDRRLAEGDIVIGEITPSIDGQFVQLCRTAVLGKPSPILIEKYNILVYAFEESLKHIKPGAPASLISIAMNSVIRDTGYGKYCYPPYMRVRGHGFGLGSNAPGSVIDDDIKVNLERHQVLVVHPNQYFPETGYLACGETVLVTDTGMERLTGTDAILYEAV